MTSFLKGLLRGNHSKHKKLLEDWASVGRETELETETAAGGSGSSEGDVIETTVGATFRVKYLGSSLVDIPNGDVATAEAIKVVIALSKASGKKLQRVNVSVTLRGIKVSNAATNEVLFDISIYRISYCSADASFNRVFAFIATNLNETMECHAFLCRKRKMAQTATLAIARTFNTAYELWQLSHEDPPAEEAPTNEPDLPEKKYDLNEDNADYKVNLDAVVEEKKKIPDNNSLLIDFNQEIELPRKENPWVLFDDDDAELPRKKDSIICPAENEKVAVDWGDISDSLDLLCLP
ncbi:low density lipoprotein receptor adapter protein 1-B-like isoform X2 [Ischnura elegans]|uniref:low density lipoprotein receptor adapter protein 1-B-like isoform X2 n=1 Tax=Ischnura elegans TaxID=197161 RepID=UPI001ED8932D|nr:low density lipoprotein receptor adapter protein 1-B-like isoform X2 [Ischnura elegans]